MNLKAALVAMAAAGTLLLLSGCGGGVGGGDGTGASTGTAPVLPPIPTPSSGATSRCQGTFVGGNLFVAEQGPVGVTLLSDGGLGPLIFDDVNSFGRGFMILYDNLFGVQGVSNPQDKFGFAKPFPPDTQAGASTQVQLQPPQPGVTPGAGPVPGTFPKGIPLQVWLKKTDDDPPGSANSSGTASIGKDTWPYSFPTASVTYGPNDTATVTFFAARDGAHFSVGLSNVFGTGCN